VGGREFSEAGEWFEGVEGGDFVLGDNESCELLESFKAVECFEVVVVEDEGSEGGEGERRRYGRGRGKMCRMIL